MAAAVLLGFREDLDSTRNETFLTTGTVHILCISGLHVGILAGALFWLMRRTRIPRGWTAAAIAAIVLLYAMMVDVGPSVVRATILVLVACVAVWLGRRPISFNSLAAAALVVLAINPEHLFHTGAQLSFLCVAGLIWFASRRPHWDDEKAKRDQTLERLILQNLSWLSRNWRKLRRSVVGIAEAGLLMWVLTMPLVLARFHVLSLAGMVANTLLWPLMSVSLLSGFGVLVFGTIFPPLACVFGWLCDESFWLLEASVKLGHRLPCGHFWLPGPGDWWLWGFYGALGLTVALPRFRLPRRWCVALLAAWIAAGFAVSAWRHDRHRLDCTFLSVGHGSAVFVEFPAGKTMLYDAGRMGEPSRGTRQISEFLWDRGLAHLDAVVLSHPDIDHYNALPELLDKFSVGAVYVSAVMFEKQNPAVRSLHSAIDHHGVPFARSRRATGWRPTAIVWSKCCIRRAIGFAARIMRAASCWRSSIAAGGFCCRATWNRRDWTICWRSNRGSARSSWPRTTAAARAIRRNWPAGAGPAGSSSATTAVGIRPRSTRPIGPWAAARCTRTSAVRSVPRSARMESECRNSSNAGDGMALTCVEGLTTETRRTRRSKKKRRQPQRTQSTQRRKVSSPCQDHLQFLAGTVLSAAFLCVLRVLCGCFSAFPVDSPCSRRFRGETGVVVLRYRLQYLRVNCSRRHSLRPRPCGAPHEH